MVVSLLFALAVSQAAVPPSQLAAAKGPMTLQQRFDAASDAAAQGKCSEAVTEFEAIEKSGATQHGGLVAAAIAVRKGVCLIGTDRSDEGEAAIRRGLPVIDAKGADFASDVRDARLGLANAELLRFDYGAAERDAQAGTCFVAGGLADSTADDLGASSNVRS